MDWYFDARDPGAIRALRDEFGRYLRRHAEPGSDVEGSEIAFSELVTNAVRHAPGPAWVHMDWSGRSPLVEVHDLGPGFELRPRLPDDPLERGGRGLFMVNHLAEDLAVAAKRGGGSRVSAVLPVARPPEDDHDPPRAATAALPAPEEASDDGTFTREPFLRALVVELARTVEALQGPGVTEAVVAQVGANIGGRMEEEYRRARGIVGRLDHEQIADLYLRLKRAIDGDFYVVEATDERIVLGNRACPFGDVVRRAPGLCRMTSSVFGGIAARNADGAAVVPEERIALGDPECRVVVRLGGEPDGGPRVGHAYARRDGDMAAT
ncbi:ATP-binding protein [Miltoncostaea marina]|uniref:ATP-binding protein n=1 Tax=Miltoncostaea marina TaxID=2843215 RepID=UPI001C3CA962|nr:methanogen output domain 1-containing protein [Miltoncostaea marina]